MKTPSTTPAGCLREFAREAHEAHRGERYDLRALAHELAALAARVDAGAVTPAATLEHLRAIARRYAELRADCAEGSRSIARLETAERIATAAAQSFLAFVPGLPAAPSSEAPVPVERGRALGHYVEQARTARLAGVAIEIETAASIAANHPEQAAIGAKHLRSLAAQHEAAAAIVESLHALHEAESPDLNAASLRVAAADRQTAIRLALAATILACAADVLAPP